MVHPFNEMLLSNTKEQTTSYRQQHGWVSNTLSYVKEARLKWKNTVWFHLYDILEMAKLQGHKINE